MTTSSHSTADELRQHRLDKLARIRSRGDEPYKYTFERSALIADVRRQFEELEAAQGEANGEGAEMSGVTVAGR